MKGLLTFGKFNKQLSLRELKKMTEKSLYLQCDSHKKYAIKNLWHGNLSEFCMNNYNK